MNIAAFAWYAGSTNLPVLPEGTEVRVAFSERPAVEFALRKGIVLGSWRAGSLFTFQGFGPGGRELVEAMLADPALRRAVEERFPGETQFHMKSASKFIRAWHPPAV